MMKTKCHMSLINELLKRTQSARMFVELGLNRTCILVCIYEGVD